MAVKTFKLCPVNSDASEGADFHVLVLRTTAAPGPTLRAAGSGRVAA